MSFTDPGKSFQAADCSGEQCTVPTMLLELLCFRDVEFLFCISMNHRGNYCRKAAMQLSKEDKAS
jgi:hypothetical protein